MTPTGRPPEPFRHGEKQADFTRYRRDEVAGLNPAKSMYTNAVSQPLSEITAVRHFRALVRHSYQVDCFWLCAQRQPRTRGRILIVTSRRRFVVHFAHVPLPSLAVIR